MVRMFDLFKKIRQSQESGVTPPFPEKGKKEEPQEPGSLQPAERVRDKKPLSAEQPQVTKAILDKQPDVEKSKALYQEAIDLIKSIFLEAQKLEPVALKNIFKVTDGIVNQMILYDAELLNLVNINSEEDSPYIHFVNVLIVSIEVGIGVGYNKSRLNELAMGALLYNIPMLKAVDLASSAVRITSEEYDSIKEHPFYGAEVLEKIEGLSDAAIYFKREPHVRPDSAEYLTGLTNARLKEYSRLISLADTYETLISKHADRKKYLPHEAIKELLYQEEKLYTPEMIKALINRIGIYPTGSWVELNTKEIAKVLESNRNAPLRPVVYVVFDKRKKRLENTRTINLTEHYNIYIKRPLDNEELKRIAQST